MADPSIALSVRPPQIRSPLDSLERAIRISDMVATANQRQQETKYQREAEPVRRAQLALQQKQIDSDTKKLQEADVMKRAFQASVRFNGKVGDLEYDEPQALPIFQQAGMEHLIPEYRRQAATQLLADRKEAIELASADLAAHAPEATMYRNFLALPQEQKPAQYMLLKRAYPELPNLYDPSVEKDYLQPAVDQYDMRRSLADRLKETEAKEAELKAKLSSAFLDPEVSDDDAWTKGRGEGSVPSWYKNARRAAMSGGNVTAPTGTSALTQSTALRKLGLRVDPVTGETVPIPRSELSAKETAELESQEALADLRLAQRESAEAKAELDKLKADPNSAVFKIAQRRLDIAQQNAETALSRLALDTEELKLRKTGTPTQVGNTILRIMTTINSRRLTGNRAKAYYEQQRALQKAAGVEIPPFIEIPSPSASLKPPKPGTKITDDVLDKYLAAHGNDAKKAAEAAKQDGWIP